MEGDHGRGELRCNDTLHRVKTFEFSQKMGSILPSIIWSPTSSNDQIIYIQNLSLPLIQSSKFNIVIWVDPTSIVNSPAHCLNLLIDLLLKPCWELNWVGYPGWFFAALLCLHLKIIGLCNTHTSLQLNHLLIWDWEIYLSIVLEALHVTADNIVIIGENTHLHGSRVLSNVQDIWSLFIHENDSIGSFKHIKHFFKCILGGQVFFSLEVLHQEHS